MEKKGGDSVLGKKQVGMIVSIAVVSFLIGTSVATEGGNPFDALWETIHNLQSDVSDLNASLVEQTNRTDSLNASYLDLLNRLEALEEQTLPQGFVTAPAYDSGWINISAGGGKTLNHNLNTTRLLVYFIGYTSIPTNEGAINQMGYGGFTRNHYGAYWCELNDTTIDVRRESGDQRWEQFRVMIWRIPECMHAEPPT
jgi:hypothetical protein